MRLSSLLFLVVSLGACVPLTKPAADAGALVLAQEEKRKCKAATVIFPAGTYTPEVQSERGIYYTASSPVRTEGVLIGKGYRGGLFIARDGRHAAWFGDARDDADERAGTLLGAIGASAPKLWVISPKLPVTPAKP
jgi:hypothetical protein